MPCREPSCALLTEVSIVFPIVTALGVDPAWFGIFRVIVLEMGLISPPVGINVFVVKGVAQDVPMGTQYHDQVAGKRLSRSPGWNTLLGD